MRKLFLFLLIGICSAQVTPNIHLNVPVHGTPNWDVQVNQNWESLDALFSGGTTSPAIFTESLNNVCIVGPSQTIAQCITALPSTGGAIYIPSSSTPYIVALGALSISVPIKFTCENPKNVTIQFTGASGVAFLFAYGAAGGDQRDTNSGIENCTILGPGGYIGSGNAGTAIQVGTAVENTFGLTIRNTVIAGFSIGVTWPTTNPSNGSIMTRFEHDVITDNTQEVVYTATGGPALTQVEFDHVIFNQQTCASDPSSIQFTGTAGGQVEFIDSYFNCEQIVANTSDLMFINPFFENSGATNTNNYISINGGLITLDNPNFLQDQASGPVMPNFVSASAGNLTVTNWRGVTGEAMTSAFSVSGTAQATIFGSRTTFGTFTSGDIVNTSSNKVLVYSSTGALGFPNAWVSTQAPAVFSGFGTGASVTNSNGTGALTLNVGTGGTASAGVITMPTAATGWNCVVNNETAAANHRSDNTVQVLSSTTGVHLENQTKSTGALTPWNSGDNLTLECFGR